MMDVFTKCFKFLDTAKCPSLKFVNSIVVVVLFILPYWLFDCKFFITGDDSHLFYVYPELWLKNIAWFSWFSFSSVSQHCPQQFIVPFVALLSVFEKVLPRLVLSNISFSAPLVLGYVFFQKMFRVLIGNKTEFFNAELAAILGGFFFIMSPILWTITITHFLYAVWVIALFPMLVFYFLRYLHLGSLFHLIYGAVTCIALSLGLFAVPWVLGGIVPVAIGLMVGALLFKISEITLFLRRAASFLSVIILTQCFWLLPFLASVLDDSAGFSRSAFSAKTQDTFAPTVMGTMFHNNILFPLLNLFHRSIVFDFNWGIAPIFRNFYDKMAALNFIFIIVVLSALLVHRRSLEATWNRTFYIWAIAWIFSLFFFTVNIGPLKNVFLFLGGVPGFSMFRNAYDKFAPGFVFIYATLVSLSLWFLLENHLIKKKNKCVLVGFFVVALLASVVPVKGIIKQPLWMTRDTYKTIDIPDEYMNFIGDIKRCVPITSNILDVPFAFPAYGVIKEAGSNNVYVGGSPLKVLTGVNDFSGYLSFSDEEAKRFHQAVLRRDLAQCERFFIDHNIGYIFLTHNIPKAVLDSYLFTSYSKQREFNDQLILWLLPNIAGEKMVVSDHGAYELYRSKVTTALFDSKHLTFKKISPIKYKLHLRNILKSQELLFRDAFSFGWKLYIEKPAGSEEKGRDPVALSSVDVHQLPAEHRLFDWEDLRYLWKRHLPFRHTAGGGGTRNVWMIDPQLIQNFGKNYYISHPDGTKSLKITLFFYPQLFYYVGAFISILSILILVLFAMNSRRRKGVSRLNFVP